MPSSNLSFISNSMSLNFPLSASLARLEAHARSILLHGHLAYDLHIQGCSIVRCIHGVGIIVFNFRLSDISGTIKLGVVVSVVGDLRDSGCGIGGCIHDVFVGEVFLLVSGFVQLSVGVSVSAGAGGECDDGRSISRGGDVATVDQEEVADSEKELLGEWLERDSSSISISMMLVDCLLGVLSVWSTLRTLLLFR